MIKFEFNGIMSDTKGVIVTQIDDNSNILKRSPVVGEKNIYRPRENYFGTMYDDNISFTIHMVKDPCARMNTQPKIIGGTLIYPVLPELQNGTLVFKTNEPFLEQGTLITPEYSDYFSSNDIRAINAWLTSPNFPKLFKFIDATYFDENIEFFATITEVSCEHSYRPYELLFTVQCDSPFGYTSEITSQITSVSTRKTQTSIFNNSDCFEDYIYPVIYVHPLSHGDLLINNVTDNGSLKVKILENADFYIDSKNLKIYDNVGEILSFDDLGIKDVDSIYFPRLCSGENIFEFMGNADIKMVYREQRKVGAFA